MTHPNQITDAQAAHDFVFGGKATFTLVSKKTGTRYTYKVTRAKDQTILFASLLTGPSNETDYQYLGFIKPGQPGLIAGRKGSPEHPAFKGLHWMLLQLYGCGATISEQVEFWHEGRCCRCNRKLTKPASIESGVGPECAKKEL